MKTKKELIKEFNDKTACLDGKVWPGAEPSCVPMMPKDMWEAKLNDMSEEKLQKLIDRVDEEVPAWMKRHGY